MSSLQGQLQRLQQETVAVTSSGMRKYVPTLIFGDRAKEIPMDTVHEISLSALLELQSHSPVFLGYEQLIFHTDAVRYDRDVHTTEQNKLYDESIVGFLDALIPFLHLPCAHRALEFLVRRFRVDLYHSDRLALNFLPYHETPVFALITQMLSKASGKHAPVDSSVLSTIGTAGWPAPRRALYHTMLRYNSALLGKLHLKLNELRTSTEAFLFYLKFVTILTAELCAVVAVTPGSDAGAAEALRKCAEFSAWCTKRKRHAEARIAGTVIVLTMFETEASAVSLLNSKFFPQFLQHIISAPVVSHAYTMRILMTTLHFIRKNGLSFSFSNDDVLLGFSAWVASDDAAKSTLLRALSELHSNARAADKLPGFCTSLDNFLCAFIDGTFLSTEMKTYNAKELSLFRAHFKPLLSALSAIFDTPYAFKFPLSVRTLSYRIFYDSVFFRSKKIDLYGDFTTQLGSLARCVEVLNPEAFSEGVQRALKTPNITPEDILSAISSLLGKASDDDSTYIVSLFRQMPLDAAEPSASDTPYTETLSFVLALRSSNETTRRVAYAAVEKSIRPESPLAQTRACLIYVYTILLDQLLVESSSDLLPLLLTTLQSNVFAGLLGDASADVCSSSLSCFDVFWRRAVQKCLDLAAIGSAVHNILLQSGFSSNAQSGNLRVVFDTLLQQTNFSADSFLELLQKRNVQLDILSEEALLDALIYPCTSVDEVLDTAILHLANLQADSPTLFLQWFICRVLPVFQEVVEKFPARMEKLWTSLLSDARTARLTERAIMGHMHTLSLDRILFVLDFVPPKQKFFSGVASRIIRCDGYFLTLGFLFSPSTSHQLKIAIVQKIIAGCGTLKSANSILNSVANTSLFGSFHGHESMEERRTSDQSNTLTQCTGVTTTTNISTDPESIRSYNMVMLYALLCFVVDNSSSFMDSASIFLPKIVHLFTMLQSNETDIFMTPKSIDITSSLLKCLLSRAGPAAGTDSSNLQSFAHSLLEIIRTIPEYLSDLQVFAQYADLSRATVPLMMRSDLSRLLQCYRDAVLYIVRFVSDALLHVLCNYINNSLVLTPPELLQTAVIEITTFCVSGEDTMQRLADEVSPPAALVCPLIFVVRRKLAFLLSEFLQKMCGKLPQDAGIIDDETSISLYHTISGMAHQALCSLDEEIQTLLPLSEALSADAVARHATMLFVQLRLLSRLGKWGPIDVEIPSFAYAVCDIPYTLSIDPRLGAYLSTMDAAYSALADTDAHESLSYLARSYASSAPLYVKYCADIVRTLPVAFLECLSIRKDNVDQPKDLLSLLLTTRAAMSTHTDGAGAAFVHNMLMKAILRLVSLGAENSGDRLCGVAPDEDDAKVLAGLAQEYPELVHVANHLAPECMMAFFVKPTIEYIRTLPSASFSAEGRPSGRATIMDTINELVIVLAEKLGVSDTFWSVIVDILGILCKNSSVSVVRDFVGVIVGLSHNSAQASLLAGVTILYASTLTLGEQDSGNNTLLGNSSLDAVLTLLQENTGKDLCLVLSLLFDTLQSFVATSELRSNQLLNRKKVHAFLDAYFEYMILKRNIIQSQHTESSDAPTTSEHPAVSDDESSVLDFDPIWLQTLVAKFFKHLLTKRTTVKTLFSHTLLLTRHIVSLPFFAAALADGTALSTRISVQTSIGRTDKSLRNTLAESMFSSIFNLGSQIDRTQTDAGVDEAKAAQNSDSGEDEDANAASASSGEDAGAHAPTLDLIMLLSALSLFEENATASAAGADAGDANDKLIGGIIDSLCSAIAFPTLAQSFALLTETHETARVAAYRLFTRCFLSRLEEEADRASDSSSGCPALQQAHGILISMFSTFPSSLSVLNVMCTLLVKYPSFFREDDTSKLMNTLLQQNFSATSSKEEVIVYSLRAMAGLVSRMPLSILPMLKRIIQECIGVIRGVFEGVGLYADSAYTDTLVETFRVLKALTETFAKYLAPHLEEIIFYVSIFCCTGEAGFSAKSTANEVYNLLPVVTSASFNSLSTGSQHNAVLLAKSAINILFSLGSNIPVRFSLPVARKVLQRLLLAEEVQKIEPALYVLVLLVHVSLRKIIPAEASHEHKLSAADTNAIVSFVLDMCDYRSNTAVYKKFLSEFDRIESALCCILGLTETILDDSSYSTVLHSVIDWATDKSVPSEAFLSQKPLSQQIPKCTFKKICYKGYYPEDYEQIQAEMQSANLESEEAPLSLHRLSSMYHILCYLAGNSPDRFASLLTSDMHKLFSIVVYTSSQEASQLLGAYCVAGLGADAKKTPRENPTATLGVCVASPPVTQMPSPEQYAWLCMFRYCSLLIFACSNATGCMANELFVTASKVFAAAICDNDIASLDILPSLCYGAVDSSVRAAGGTSVSVRLWSDFHKVLVELCGSKFASTRRRGLEMLSILYFAGEKEALTLVPEAAGVIVERLEDESEAVENAARKLVNTIESVSGEKFDSIIGTC